MILRKLVLIFTVFILISSCQDVDMYEKDKFGSLSLSFVQPSDELINSLENSRTSSQLADVDQVRITIGVEAPTTVSIINGTASYSRSGLPVGTISVKVDLLGAGITKYSQTKSVTIIADQQTSASFNAFAITNQSISYTSTLESTYDVGNDINLSWTNSHAEQPVNIERWDQVGGVWVKSSTIESNFVGTSYTWNTQGESSGENVKVRIQSTISSSFIDSQPFQLLADDNRYVDIVVGHSNGGGSDNQFIVGWDFNFQIIWGDFSGDVDIYWYDTDYNQLVTIVEDFGQSDSTVCAGQSPGSCQYLFYPSNSFNGNNFTALIPLLNSSDGDTFPSSQTKKFRVCEAGTTDCVDSSESYQFTGWSMNNSFSNVTLTYWNDPNPSGSGGGTGSKYLWSTSMNSINVSTSGGSGRC